MRNRAAFSLIELLIVVAIIAILAAIAVPNLLEAQTRAKMSRAMADMRTVAVAMNAYTVDYNRAPPGFYWYDHYGYPQPPGEGHHRYLVPLSTPVAYVTALPPDPFTTHKIPRYNIHSSHNDTFGHFDLTKHYDASKVFYAHVEHGYDWALQSAGPSTNLGDPEDGANSTNIRNAAWVLEKGTEEAALSIYDATNGTRSYGFVIYTNKGFYDGQQASDLID